MPSNFRTRLYVLWLQLSSALQSPTDRRTLIKTIEFACRARCDREPHTFLELHPQLRTNNHWRPPLAIIVGGSATSTIIVFFTLAAAASGYADRWVRSDVEHGQALLSYAGICGTIVGFLFAIFVFSAERAVERLGRCAFLLSYILRWSRSLVYAGISLGIVLALSLAGLLAEFAEATDIVAGSVVISVPSIFAVAVLTLQLLRQALHFAQGEVLSEDLAKSLSKQHERELRLSTNHTARRAAFEAELQKRGGTFTPYMSFLYRDIDAIEIPLPANRRFIDFDLVAFDSLLLELKQRWPNTLFVMAELLGDSWTTAPTFRFVADEKGTEVIPIDRKVRDDFARRASSLFILKKLKKKALPRDDLSRIIAALPHIARDESADWFSNVLELLEHYAAAELAGDLQTASGKMFDFFEHRSWHDVVDAVLEASSRSKLEIFWSFLQSLKYAAAARRDGSLLESVLIIQRSTVWRSLQLKSAHIDWLGKEADDSLATPSFISGISSSRFTRDDELPRNAVILEVLYIRHCMTLAYYFHENDRATDANNALDRLIERYQDLAGINNHGSDTVPLEVRRYLLLGIIYMMGWAIWKLSRGDDEIAGNFLQATASVHFGLQEVIDAWCHIAAADDGAGIISHIESWQHPRVIRSGKSFSSGQAAFPNLGYVASLLLAHRHSYGRVASSLNESHLRFIERNRIEHGVLRIAEIGLAASKLEEIIKKPLKTVSADLNDTLEPLRRHIQTEELQKILNVTADPEILTKLSSKAVDQVLSAYATSSLLQLAHRASRKTALPANSQPLSEVYTARFSKAMTLPNCRSTDDFIKHAFDHISPILEVTVTVELSKRGEPEVTITRDNDGRELIKEGLRNVQSTGQTVLALVCSYEDVGWLCGEQHTWARLEALEQFQNGEFESVPVICLPRWKAEDIMIMTESHFVPAAFDVPEVNTSWTADNTLQIAAQLERALTCSPPGPVPDKFSPQLTIEISAVFPFEIVRPGGVPRYRVFRPEMPEAPLPDETLSSDTTPGS